MSDALALLDSSLTCENPKADWLVVEPPPNALFGGSLAAVSLLGVLEVVNEFPPDPPKVFPPPLLLPKTDLVSAVDGWNVSSLLPVAHAGLESAPVLVAGEAKEDVPLLANEAKPPVVGAGLLSLACWGVGDMKVDGPLDAYAPNPPVLGWEAGTTVEPKPGFPKAGWPNED